MSTYGLVAFSLDPVGPAADGDRVLLGGSWYNNARQIEAAYRGRGMQLARIHGVGFRLTRTIT